jgi:hypothetical protein
LSILAWQTGFELSRTQDKQDIMMYLSDINNKQELMNVTQMQQQADLRQIMTLMQKVSAVPVN